MRYSPEHKQQSRTRILTGAGRSFRKFGFGGIGVDGLAQEAGVTSGAFYGHFNSKAEAFCAAVVSGLQELREGINSLQANSGEKWLDVFTQFYLGPKRTCDLAESCALQSLSTEVSRADVEIKTAYEVELVRIAESVAAGLPDVSQNNEKAWAVLALLVGGTTMARAVENQAVAETIVDAVKNAVLALTTEDTKTVG